ncbi:hypothetical protein EVG20_g6292 [Dentipellis fragilis]|uniref:GH16 domain-containing protein n=1 Tax=Dentipellis fragilis TaxID=205917 RepID=A0A4Y9YP63_9AGAM|nr:hypothetical protein EVG20_g6292 [Dentipellis fragilis]
MRNLLVLLLPLLSVASAYDLVREYSGQTFFDRWDFYGNWDNLTLGDVWWQDRNTATQQRLAYINDNGRAVMRVDNSSNVPFNEKRNSIRITSQDTYGVGSLWIIDLTHIPFGCSVWPAFWTKGPLWPDNGEIDIIEAINVRAVPVPVLVPYRHPVLTSDTQIGHEPQSTGSQGPTDCSLGSGCVVSETKPNSFNEGFAQAGGGVFATQFDVSGIFMWYWSVRHSFMVLSSEDNTDADWGAWGFQRADIPASIQQATSTSSIDISQWGTPSASFPASGCNIPQYFTAQNLVFDITLCGVWAGVPSIYTPACGHSGSTGLCYNDNVVGPGSPKYDDAYFEINYVRAYSTGPSSTPTPIATGAANSPNGVAVTVTSGAGVSTTAADPAGPTTTTTTNDAGATRGSNGSAKLLEWKELGLLAVSLVGLVSSVLVLV